MVGSVRARSLPHFHLLHIDIKKHLIGRLSNSCTGLLILGGRVIWRVAYIVYVGIVDWAAPDWILVLPINYLTAGDYLLLYVMKKKIKTNGLILITYAVSQWSFDISRRLTAYALFFNLLLMRVMSVFHEFLRVPRLRFDRRHDLAARGSGRGR